jgi:hypothetical protein
MTSANKDLNQKIDAFLQQIKTLAKDVTERLAKLTSRCQALYEAATNIADSWSGSYFGYHCELYYGNFEKPPLENAFSPEWGGTYGIPEGWISRTSEEVKNRIEDLAESKFEDVQSETKPLLESVQEVQQEIVIELSIIHGYNAFEAERELLSQVEKYSWGRTIAEYIQSNLPQHFMSRDSEAVHQGARTPAHLFYQAEAVALKSQGRAIADFLKLCERLLRQVQIKLPTIQPEPRTGNNADLVILLCKRFHFVARQLQQRQRGRTPFEINDEYDVQDLLHALLRLHFEDVRPEEWTPSYAGKSSRMDFLLKQEKIVIETKMTREKLGTAEVSDELIIDVAHYKEHRDCGMLACLVYDPAVRIKNPRGFEADIARQSDPEMRVVCIITP